MTGAYGMLYFPYISSLRKCSKKAPNLGAFQKKYEVEFGKGGFLP